MQTQSVLGEFAQSAGRLQGVILGLVGVAAATIVWFVAPDLQIRVAWLWVVTTPLLIIIWLLIDVARRLIAKPSHLLPKVVTALPSNGLNHLPILILEPSELFGFQAVVTIYYLNNADIELQVGNGHVLTIQTDRRIQIEVTHWAKAHNSVLNEIKLAAPDTLKRVLIKPTATYGVNTVAAFVALPAEIAETDDQGAEDDQ